VAGADAAAKMAILARLAFGAPVALSDVYYEGITEIQPDDIAYAKELGLSLKLLGIAERRDGGISVRVFPCFLYSGHPLAPVEGPFNAVMVEAPEITEITMSGPGAGGVETASAVLGDVFSILSGREPVHTAPHSLKIVREISSSFYLKLEGANPTGSFKDRGMTVAVSRAKGAEAEAIICASTGNTAASCAAYAARAGLRGAVIVPEGKIAIGKLAQALMHGARVIALRGNFDRALEIVRELAKRHPFELVNSVNPHRLEGEKTAAFEVCDELSEPPDALAIPVGNAGNITAWWRGFGEYDAAPVLYGFQAEGAAPLVIGRAVAAPETVASAIRIGNPARWEEAMDAV